MQDNVKKKLRMNCNKDQTYLDFIRETEQMLGEPEQDFDNWTLDQLNEYIDFLDDMWNK